MKSSLWKFACLSLAVTLVGACGEGKFGSTTKEKVITEVRYEKLPETPKNDDQKPETQYASDDPVQQDPEVIVLGPPEKGGHKRDDYKKDEKKHDDDMKHEDEDDDYEDDHVVVVHDPSYEDDHGKDDEYDDDHDHDDDYRYEDEKPGDVYGGHWERRRPNDDDNRALKGCSTAFGRSLPLGFDGSVRTIAANVSVLSSGVALRDTRVTARPEVTLIYASIGVLSNLRWELLNPNGLYCIVTNVNVLSKLTIFLEERAQLSDGLVHINVLSSSNADTATVGVNVLSNVKVYRVRRK